MNQTKINKGKIKEDILLFLIGNGQITYNEKTELEKEDIKVLHLPEDEKEGEDYFEFSYLGEDFCYNEDYEKYFL